MAVPVSLCCLLASPDRQPYRWPTGFYQIELAEPDPRVAKEFVELAVDTEGAKIAEFTTDVLVANIHPGHIEFCPEIFEADMAVDPDREIRLHPLTLTYTVCGMFDNGQCYSGLWTDHGPLMAYAAAFTHFQALDRFLFVAGVHPGVVETETYAPVWADVGCSSVEEMEIRLAELDPNGFRLFESRSET